MKKTLKKRLRKLNVATHRDLGYFFSALIIIYCLSGIALNHMDIWNPDFIIQRQTILFSENYTRDNITSDDIQSLSKVVGEENIKVYDFPTSNQVKIYYDNASLHVNFTDKEGVYEKISRRPVFYHVNVFHRNSIKGWQWASDVFAFLLITINITGLFILKGKYGIGGRGKWLIAAGLLIPFIVLVASGML